MKAPKMNRFSHPFRSRPGNLVQAHLWSGLVILALLVLLPSNARRVQALSLALRGQGYGLAAWQATTAPVAAFTSNITAGEAPLIVQFIDQSTGAPTRWHWDFGDGTTSPAPNPIHQYQSPGGYDVTLTVSNEAGTQTLEQRTYIIVNSAPVIEPIVPPDLPSLFEDPIIVDQPTKEALPDSPAIAAQLSASPNTPVLQSPANGATSVSTPSTTLQSCVSDPDGGNLTVTFYGRDISPMNVPDFTIVAMPDTQFYYSSDGTSAPGFLSQVQWIVNNRANRNIVFVSHLGDVVDDGSNPGSGTADAQWATADRVMATIENPTLTTLPDGIPYGIAVGNHDQGTGGGGANNTYLFNQYFGVSRFTGRQYYGGYLGSDNDNSYQLFSVGDLKFITIHIEFDTSTRPATFAWIDNLLQTHADRLAILSAHEILNANGTWRTPGERIWQNVRDNPNIFLMLAGHIAGEARRQDVAYHGNVVNTFLSDYQNRKDPQGQVTGDGLLRYMQFQGNSSEVTVYTYSTTRNAYEEDADSFFKEAWDTPSNGPLRRPFQVIGKVANVASGSCTTVTWNGLAGDRQYEWYVGASDSPNDSTVAQAFSSRATFSTGAGGGSATPTSTATSTPVPPTMTPTPTPSGTFMPTPTATSTSTTVPPAMTDTPTPTGTLLPSPTTTGTSTGTTVPPTMPDTPTGTLTPNPTATTTGTLTPSPTVTATRTDDPATATATPTATATIDSSPPLTVGFGSSVYIIADDSKAATLTITLNKPAPFPITLTYSAADVTAAAQLTSRATITGEIVIATGETSTNLELPILPEWVTGKVQEINLQLTASDSNVIFGQASISLFITPIQLYLPLIPQTQ
ncbi:MAG: PKD domain-containing protein [Caldilineaceae bacterium]|nr:PKD domain-containing protein [Caldilineaceae bacterium]